MLRSREAMKGPLSRLEFVNNLLLIPMFTTIVLDLAQGG